MCILFIFTDPNPQEGAYRLIIASNRDEYYVRPARAAFLDEKTKVIGGWDMEGGREGGMWLGVSLAQTNEFKLRFGALLNVTGEERHSGVKGRGFLVKDYLSGGATLKDYVDDLGKINEQYNAYNLVSVEIREGDAKVYHHSNKVKDLFTYEGKQVLGFGNSNPISPLTKVRNGRLKFEDVVKNSNSTACRDQLIERLLDLLKWEDRHLPDPELQRRAPLAYEQLSQVFVKFVEAGYGSRTHTIILVDKDWNFEFIESTLEEPIDITNPKWNTQFIKSHL